MRRSTLAILALACVAFAVIPGPGLPWNGDNMLREWLGQYFLGIGDTATIVAMAESAKTVRNFTQKLDTNGVAANAKLLQGKDTTALWNAKTLQGRDTTTFVRPGASTDQQARDTSLAALRKAERDSLLAMAA